MVFEEEFFYGGQLRWALGWATPNYAGAFLAALIPWFWLVNRRSDGAAPRREPTGDAPGSTVAGGTGRRFRRVSGAALGWALELALWFCLAKTYSRGALVAALAAAVGWHWLQRRRKDPGRAGTADPPPGVRVAAGINGGDLMFRLAIVGGCLVLTGFAGRLAPWALSADRAVGNRWELWKGGAEMLAAAPLSGWGAGESGQAYMDWFQDLDRSEGYATMVNSFLHLAVDHGLPALGGVLLLGFALLATGMELARLNRQPGEGGRRAGAAAAVASLLAWAVANIFTTLWIEPRLWLVPAVALAFLAILSWRDRSSLRWRRIAPASVLGATLLVSALFSAGCWLRSQRSWRAAPGPGNTVVVKFRRYGRIPRSWDPPPARSCAAGSKRCRRLPSSSFTGRSRREWGRAWRAGTARCSSDGKPSVSAGDWLPAFVSSGWCIPTDCRRRQMRFR
jgi:hypothetical protein